MIHITLTAKTLANDPTDPLGRTYYGWGEHDSVEANWANNRGYYVLGARADRQNYVLFSHQRKVVMAARITSIVDAKGKPGKRIINGKPLGEGDPVYDTYVDGRTPDRAVGVRNPVTYVEGSVPGRPCGCGCGQVVFEGEFVRGHEQTALHQRVAEIGTIAEFLRWFDAIDAGEVPRRAQAPVTVSGYGRIEFTADDGKVTLAFAPAAEPGRAS